MTAAESVNEEAVDWTNTEMAGARAIRGYAPGARINLDSDNWLAALRTSREVLAAALAELAAARDREAAVRALTVIPDHECGEICEAFGCDNEGVSYVVPMERLLAALSQSEPTKERSE